MPYVIKHAGADHLALDPRTGNAVLVGAISYYAELSDAAAHHAYVQTRVICSPWAVDYLGKPFEVVQGRVFQRA